MNRRVASRSGYKLRHPILRALVARRVELGITQMGLANQLYHDGKSQLSGWECGERTPNFKSLIEWAGALGYDIGITLRGDT